MKIKTDYRKITGWLEEKIPPWARTKKFLAAVCALAFTLAIILGFTGAGRAGSNPDEFVAGKVAERDVIAEIAITYEDAEGTRRRQAEQERLVPAVFYYSSVEADTMLSTWNRFSLVALDNFEKSSGNFMLAIHENFPMYFSLDVLDRFFRSRERYELLGHAGIVFSGIIENGIYSMPFDNSLERLNPEMIELIRSSGSRVESERIFYDSIITIEKIPDEIESRLFSGHLGYDSIALIKDLTEPFFEENVYFSSEETGLRIAEAHLKADPVIKFIERGKNIIKKGFIITEENIMELAALNMSRVNDIRIAFSRVLLLLLVFGSMTFLSGKRIMGRELSDPEAFLICMLSALYVTGTVLAKNLFSGFEFLPVSIVIPTALVVLLPAVLIHPRIALMLSVALPLASYFGDAYDFPSFVFALVSGTTASYVLQGAEKRMDLVRAGFVIAVVNCLAITAILLGQRAQAGVYPGLLFWSFFNGIASGMLVFGFLPPLENALGAATAFRLIELSDLNVPILRRLFTTAPGTYSHSIMVANLAEVACQDIGANPLLARVGAYYHDIGKMETPNYFVENQKDMNPHDDIAPRHSVTVIRNHVKQGVEKARQLKLPQEVLDIVGDHHGNSVITWFYDKALKLEEKENGKKRRVNPEDYSYQGSPPSSRESAVVMLADMTEAAARTLEKPTPEKLDKYIEELMSSKVEYRQLARSELTFKDLEIIRKAFVRVLMSYNHSRISYPKIGNINKPGKSEKTGKKKASKNETPEKPEKSDKTESAAKSGKSGVNSAENDGPEDASGGSGQ